MIRTSDAMLMAIFGTVALFSIIAVFLGEAAALWLFRFALVAALLAGAAWAVIWCRNRLADLNRQNRLNRRKAEAEARLAEKDAGLLSVHKLHGPGMIMAVDHTGEKPVITSHGYHPYTPQTAAHAPALPQQTAAEMPPLLPVLTSLDRALIVAGMGSGKSELLKWIAQDAADIRGGDVTIIDSHASPDTWPIAGVNVVGIGRDYEQIEATVNYICNEMDKRYKQRADGRRKRFHPVTMIIDELTVLNQFCDLKNQFKSLLCECRKVNIRLFMAGQSDRANALGLKGNNDLRAGFEAIVYLKKRGCIFSGDVFHGASKEPETFIHPGIFCHGHGVTVTPGTPRSRRDHDRDRRSCDRDPVTGIDYQPGQVFTPPAEPAFYECHAHKTIVEMHRAGASLNKIAMKVWGYSKGAKTKEIQRILRRYKC